MGKPGCVSNVEEFLPGSNNLRKRYLLLNLKMRSLNTMLGMNCGISKNIVYMMRMVKAYLSGEMPIHIFELDFQIEIISGYRKVTKQKMKILDKKILSGELWSI